MRWLCTSFMILRNSEIILLVNTKGRKSLCPHRRNQCQTLKAAIETPGNDR